MSNSNFIHLSVRSDMSATSKSAIGDFAGSARVPELVARAVELGHSALACTELGSLRGIYQLTVECERAGIQPIYGVEVYVTADHTKKAVPKELHAEITAGLPPGEWRDAVDAYAARHGYMQGERGLATLTLWALDSEGLSNLVELTSRAWIDGYYYKPRVDPALIEQYSAGLACGTGGPNSWVNRPLIAGKRREALDRARALARIFGDRLYAEVMPHGLMNHATANAFAIDLRDACLAILFAIWSVL
jgi:DNA polymerase-3 subunit alpha